MSTYQYRPLPSQMDRRRIDVDRINIMTGGTTRFSSFISIQNPGELVQDVIFPIVFTEEPVFFWGVVMDPASPAANGNFPIVSPVVKNWLFTVKETTGIRWYTGATLAIVTTGVDGQSMVVQAHFEARALRNPVQL